jgi:hypothetical protein
MRRRSLQRSNKTTLLCCCCRVEFLSSFAPPPGAGSASVATPLVERFAARLLVLFVRHAALLRPLSQAGKLQLAKVRFITLCAGHMSKR